MTNANLYFFNLDDELLGKVKADINAAVRSPVDASQLMLGGADDEVGYD